MLHVRDLTKRFASVTALDAVSCDINSGTIHGLIGPNGSGKTTFFNCVTGFIKPTSGTVSWHGEDLTRKPPYRIARLGIARTFQNTSNYGNFSLRQNLVMASRNQIRTSPLSRFLNLKSARSEEADQARQADALLERFGLRELADIAAADLPGGTQKVLGVAIALSAAPDLLMLDEPLAGLNSGEKVQLMDLLRGIRGEGQTILIIEHDMKAIMQTCDQITVLCFGEKLAEGSAAEVSQDPATIRAYLGEEAT